MTNKDWREQFGKEGVRGQVAATWSECSIRRIISYGELTLLFILIERVVGWTVKKEKSFKRGLPKDKDKNEGFSGVWPNILVWVCKLLFLCGSRTIKTSLRLTFFLLLHKANNTCISLKRYLSLACMCSILSILALKGFLESAPHFI